VYDDELGALVSWLPFDAALPVLLEPPDDLAARLQRGGIDVPSAAHEPQIVGYKPGERVVLQLDGHVLKGYRTEEQFRRALTGLTHSSSLGSIATAGYEASFPDLRLTVQATVEGDTPENAAQAAEAAGQILKRLQRERVGHLEHVGASELLQDVTRRAELVEALVPELRARLAAVLARLRETVPASEELLPAHGDFHVDQLLRAGGEHVVLDFDGMCLASPALDLATYLADVVRGRGRDVETIDAVRGPLLAGYGTDVPDLDWYLAAIVLIRAPHPFHRFATGWPERVEGMVRAAEELLT
jgi:Phosphotransferase enzyme family